MKPKIRFICLGVSDLEKSRLFYSGYFADPDGHLWEVVSSPYTDLT